MKRLDQALVDLSLARSRSQASELIKKGFVEVRLGDWKKITKPSFSFDGSVDDIRISENSYEKYVSRGGVKLEGALDVVGLDVDGFVALDLGMSTGGFTDCLLQKGAKKVLGIDVGHAQLSDKLVGDDRVISLEGVNVRELNGEVVQKHLGDLCVDLAVMDLSFISLQLVIPVISSILQPEGLLLSLIKPQFEVGSANLSKGGLVRDKELYKVVLGDLKNVAEKCDFQVLKEFPSSIEGGDGNTEFFLYARKN